MESLRRDLQSGAVSKWYPRNGVQSRRKKAVERRSTGLPGEYRNPLIKLDTKYHGPPDGRKGPLVRRLDSYGDLLCLVVGSFQEASKDLHALLDWLTDAKMRSIGLARGWEGSDHERSVILLNLRRELSTAAAKANSACLLSRVAKIGDGHRLAAKRRVWARGEVEKRQEEAKSHWLANIRGRGLFRSLGEFFNK